MKTELKFFLIGVGSTIGAIILLVGLFFIIFGGKKVYRDSDENDIVTSGENKYKLYDYKEESIVCSALVNAKYHVENYFITKDGDLYIINSEKKYSDTDENCKRLSDKKFKAFMPNGSGFVSDDNELYSNYDNEFKLRCSAKDNNCLNEFRIYKKMLTNYNIVKFTIAESNYKDNKYYYTYVAMGSDGILHKIEVQSSYDYDYKKDENVYNDKLIKESVIDNFNGEKVLDFMYYSSGGSGYAVTDKGIYYRKAINPECVKYADIICEYEYAKEDYYTERMNDIFYVNNLNSYDNNRSLTYMDKNGNKHSITLYTNEI